MINTFNRIKFGLLSLCILFVVSIFVILESFKYSSEKPPNIIFIMSDDHAKKAISCYGGNINETINIDRLANEGARFQNSFVTNSICAPSRAVFLTGKYSHINGLKDNLDMFDSGQLTFPKMLQNAGYQTALIGKWHLKTKPQGFDTWKILSGQGRYYNPLFITGEDTIRHQGYVTTLITDFAIETIDKFDKNRPFCLLYFHSAPHRNWMPDIKHLNMYDSIDVPLPNTFFDDYKTRSNAVKQQDMKIVDLYNSLDMKINSNDFIEKYSGGNKEFRFKAKQYWTEIYNDMTDEQKTAWDSAYEPKNNAFINADLSGMELAKWKFQRYIKDYLRCVTSIDENIGRLLGYLDKNNLVNNTIVIYTSDQGFYLGEHGWYDKRFMYEESLGIPMIIRYPKEIKPGIVLEPMVLNLDICSTILDFADVNIPEEIQGESLRPLLNGKKNQSWRKSIYYHYYEYPHGWHNVNRHEGIRTKDYKLINFYQMGEKELYNIEKDPNELNNLYKDKYYTQTKEKLEKELSYLRKKYQVPIN